MVILHIWTTLHWITVVWEKQCCIFFEEVDYEFYYDTASFLQAYGKTFSLAGLEVITGVNQTQPGHYLHGRRKPRRQTIDKIQKGVERFAKELTALRFA